MIIYSKFNIGQQVRHILLDFLGVIIDIDTEFNYEKKKKKQINKKKIPWYHVITEDNNGHPIHTYLSENQLSIEMNIKHPEQPSLDELSKLIKKQIKKLKQKN